MYNDSLVRRIPSAATVSDVFDRYFNGPFWGGVATPSRSVTADLDTWTPAVDVTEEVDSFVFRADLPGMSKDDIEVTIEDNVLTLSGERQADSETTHDGYRRRERSWGKFARQFSLPTNVDSTKVAAGFKNGVLEVRVPKSEASKAHKIKVA